MILKNTSDTYTIVVNTAVGKIAIKPEEIVDIKHKLFPPLFSELVVASEQEYLAYKKGKNNETFTESVDTLDDTTDENKTNDVINELLNQPKEKRETKSVEKKKETKTEISEALKVKETKIDDESTVLEDKIKSLEQTWITETNPKSKEKIGKELKKVKKQLEKLNKAK